MRGPGGRIVSLFQREAKFPLAGRKFYGGARGRVASLLQREAKFPLAGSDFMEGPGGGFRNTSP